MDHKIDSHGRGMEPPRTVFAQGPLAALLDVLGVANLTLLLGVLLVWHARQPFLTRLLPSEPYGLAVVAIAGAYFTALYVWLTSRLQRVLLGADCLTLCYTYRQRQLPWSTIRRFARLPGRFRVSTTDDVIEFTDQVRHAEILLANAQARLPEPQPAEIFEPGVTDPLAGFRHALLVWLPPLLLAIWFDRHLPEPRHYAVADSVAAWMVAITLVIQTGLVRRHLREHSFQRLELTADGLRLVFQAGRPRDYRWADVEQVQVVSDGLALRAAGVEHRLPLLGEVARAAAASIQAGMAAAEPTREQVFEQPPVASTGVFLAAWCGGLLFALVCCWQASATHFDYAWDAPLLRLGLLLALLGVGRQLLPRLVRRVTVGDGGVRLSDRAEVTELPWETVRGASRTRFGWQIETSLGAVRFAGVFVGQEDLLDQIRRGLARAQASVSEAERVEHAEIAGWLGITADDCLEVRALRARPLILGGVIWLLIAGGLLPAMYWSTGANYHTVDDYVRPLAIANLGMATVPVWLFWLCYYPVHLAILLRADALRRVYASGHGLRWRNGSIWRQAGWNEVLSVSLVPREHQQKLFYWSDVQVAADREVLVECVGQRLRFHPKDQHAERLQRALDRLLKARQAGLTMPGLSEVPANAISRAELRDASAELGLSRVAPEG